MLEANRYRVNITQKKRAKMLRIGKSAQPGGIEKEESEKFLIVNKMIIICLCY